MKAPTQPLPLHLPTCTTREHDAEMAGAAVVRTPAQRRIAAQYLRDHDPDMLAWLTGMAKAFGPAEEVALQGYPGLQERLDDATQAQGQAGIAEAKRLLSAA